MDMVVVITVGAGPQHCRKAVTGGIPQVIAKLLRNGIISGFDLAPARYDKGADIDGIALAVLAEFGVGDAIATAAFVRTEGFDAAQRVQLHTKMTGSLVADPGSKRFRHRAAENGGRPDLDTFSARQQDRLQPDHVAATAVAGTEEPRQQLDRGDFRQSLIAIAQRACDILGIETGACRFGKGVGLRPKWRPRSRQRNVFHDRGRSPNTFIRSCLLALLWLRFCLNPRRRSRAVTASMHFSTLALPVQWVEQASAIFVISEMRRVELSLSVSYACAFGYRKNSRRLQPMRKSGLGAHMWILKHFTTEKVSSPRPRPARLMRVASYIKLLRRAADVDRDWFERELFGTPQVPNPITCAAGNKPPIKFVCASRDSDDRPPSMTL